MISEPVGYRQASKGLPLAAFLEYSLSKGLLGCGGKI
jgi:hypothetical protein